MKNITLIILTLFLTSCASTTLSSRTDALKNKIKNMSSFEGIKDYQKKAWSKKK